MSAASQAKRSMPDIEVIVFERSGHTSYSACGMPYLLKGDVGSEDSLVVRTPEQFAERGIQAKIRHEVVDIDLGSGSVKVEDLASGTRSEVAFDELVVATGSYPTMLDVPGADAGGVFALRDLDSGIALHRHLMGTKPQRAVIIGAGYIGVEVADAFIARGIDTTIVEASGHAMGTFDEDLGETITGILVSSGVKVELGEAVDGIEVSSGSAVSVVAGSKTFPADVVVMAVGSKPNVALAERAGIEIGQTGAIKVDDHMRTSHAGVWAAGDCTEQKSIVTQQPVSIHLGTVANKMGRIAGINIGGGDVAFPGVAGTALSRFGDTEFARTGIDAAAAEAFPIAHLSVVSRSRTKASYYPGSEPIHTKLLFENPSGRLLGAQIVGGTGSGKRIDIFAMAIWNRMRVQDMLYADLAYHPSVSGVWDPALIAVRKAAEMIEA